MPALLAAMTAWMLVAAPAHAQDSLDFILAEDTTYVVDRVVAVVGNEAILASEIDEEFFLALQGSEEFAASLRTPADTARVRDAILDRLVNEELIVQAASRDTTIIVTAEEVNQTADEQLRSARSRFPSESEFNTELLRSGFQSSAELRRFLGEQARRKFMRDRFIEALKNRDVIKTVNPTDAEMREFFEAQKAQIGQRPASISFKQIVVTPQPSATAKQAAFARADSIARALRTDGDFAAAARRFSQDSGSAVQGGDLGWQRRGTFVRSFDDVVFNLKPGTISNPVETVYGYHVIQVQRIQPTEVNARHILIVPETTPENVDSARALAARVVDQLRAGARFDSLQTAVHDEAEEKEARDAPLTALPPSYSQVVADADSGAVVGPFELPGPGGKVKFAVLVVGSRRAAGEVAFADVREQIRAALAGQLGEQQYLARLRDATYVDIRTESP
jgi:peptidyl-prolyl cis-trans isomerase SurA